MFHIVILQPQIPPNTGNIIRLCANTGSTLHLVHPMGFDLSGKAVRRAGLDYEWMARVHVHANFADCRATLGQARLLSIETSGSRLYSQAQFHPGDALLFGSESYGLSAEILSLVPRENQLTIPMRSGNRSLNLSNSVALTVYEAWRQNDFA
jgi:tRNA (cytidine/uridine-2'-O-)-methyltransferase